MDQDYIYALMSNIVYSPCPSSVYEDENILWSLYAKWSQNDTFYALMSFRYLNSRLHQLLDCELYQHQNEIWSQNSAPLDHDNRTQNVLFDQSFWDETPYHHPQTQAPIFVYRVLKDGVEVGSAHFYNQPSLCRTESVLVIISNLKVYYPI